MLALDHAIPYKAHDIAAQSFRRWTGFRKKMESAEELLCLRLIVKSQISAESGFTTLGAEGCPSG